MGNPNATYTFQGFWNSFWQIWLNYLISLICLNTFTWTICVQPFGVFQNIFQQSNVANLPNSPNWPWPMTESINLTGGFLGHVFQHDLFKCIQILNMSSASLDVGSTLGPQRLLGFSWLNMHSVTYPGTFWLFFDFVGV